MTETFPRTALFLTVLFAVSIAAAQATSMTGQGGKPAAAAPRAIPGITAKDQFPRGCVDCHVNYTDQKMDLRFSTLMKQWTEKVDPQLLKRVAGSAPTGVTLKGKHPPVLGTLKNVPAGCLPCHGRTSTMAPPFSKMMHALHLSGGKDNRFLTQFQGECMHCHKLNAATGAWSLPSGPEK